MENNQIVIVQLSDIHFSRKRNSILEKEEKLFDSIKNECCGVENVFILVTGDIAYSGKREEYEIAKRFFDSLIDKLKIYTKNNTSFKFIFTPGNHDCDFGENQDVRNVLIENILANPDNIPSGLIDGCISIQKEYFEFIKTFDSNDNLDNTLSNKLFFRYIFDLNGKKVVFHSYNLSWLSKKNEKQAKLIYPVSNIDKELIIDDTSTLTVSLFHHPFHWLTHQNIREFREIINKSSNILLTGHEHTTSGQFIKSVDNDFIIQHIEASALQENNDNQSSFNLINIDLEASKQELYEFKWNKNCYVKKIMNDNLSVKKKKQEIFNFKENYYRQLTQLGIKINHPTKDDLELRDVYIHPDMKVLNIDETAENSSFVETSSNYLENMSNVKHTIIYGAETSGKTSLLQMLQLKYKKDEFIPLYIDYIDFELNDYKKEKLKKLILKTFKKQYQQDTKTTTAFEQLDKNKIVLLIDNFEKINLNSEYKAVLLENIKSLFYENIIITAHENLKLEGTTEGELATTLKSWAHYYILPFGHKLRHKFIKNWIHLGQEHSIEKKDLLLQTKDKAEMVDKTIGHNFVPAYPIYIMTLLQAMTTNDSNDLSKSSYAHYYNYLILDNLKKTGEKMDPKTLNTIFGFTSTLAFEIFEKKNYLFSENFIIDFYTKYCQRIRVSPSFNVIDTLKKSSIIIEIDNNLKFTHNFIYYYFVAEYFREHYDKEKMQEIIYKMIKRMYRTEFANILMFIIHLSPKEPIINRIIDESMQILNDEQEFQFLKDEVKTLTSTIKIEVIEHDNTTTVEENHEDNLERKEKADTYEKKINKQDRDEADYDETIKQLNLFGVINLAFKMIEIQGEIIKNYSGTLEGEIKYNLITGTHSIGLRTLKAMVSLFENEHDLIVKEISKIIKKKKHITDDKKQEDINSFIFSLASNISTNVITKIAKATASKDLVDLNKEIIDEDRDNISKQLIEQAQVLDFDNGLNIKSIENIYKQYEQDKNVFSTSVLKKLVLEHLYMFDIKFDKRQSVCKKLKINEKSSKNKLISSKK